MLRRKNLLFMLVLLMIISCKDPNIPKPENNLPSLEIGLKAEQRVKLRRKREAALRIGILESKDKDYVPAEFTYDGQSSKGQLRLKGDWLDHLKSNKWSYRVKLDSAHSLLGMQKFSIQHPKTRSYLDEYIFHLLLMQEGILTTKYDFINVKQNGIYKGIYAIEEHFDKMLIEKQRRREGPILRFNEDGFWEAQKYLIENKQDPNFFSPIFEAAEIKFFGTGNILRDSSLGPAFIYARQKLEDLRSGSTDLSELVDLDKMAKFFALCDITQAYHSLTWHNLRFYYNSLNARLEPVAFDAYATEGVYHWFSKPFLGFYNDRYAKVYYRQEFMIFQFFNDPDFSRKYLMYLEKFCEPGFIEDFFRKYEGKLTKLERCLSYEFSDYHYQWSFLPERINELRLYLKDYSLTHPPFQYEVFEPNYTSCMVNYPLPHASLVASKIEDLPEGTVQVRNYFCEPVRLIATGTTKSRPIHTFTKPIELASYDIQVQPQPHTLISIPPEDSYIFYEVQSNSAWYRTKLSSIPACSEKLISDVDRIYYDSSLFVHRNDTLFLTRGKYCLDRLQVFPQHLTLVIEAGVEMDLVNEGGLLIKGDLQMNGRQDLIINIYSSDDSSNGLTMTGPAKAAISWTHFNAINPINAFGTAHSGGLSFHEVSLKMLHCQISNVKSEDGINIISSPSTHLEGLIFQDCQKDALDVDFSMVDIFECKFKNVNGDAIDLSGSRINLDSVEIESVGDKGISIGENTKASMNNLTIYDSYIGIAVKDGSEASVKNLTVDSATFAIAVFKKKHFYPTSVLRLDNIQLENNQNDICLENAQRVFFDNQRLAVTDTTDHFSKVFYRNTN
ncbi:MAG: CotH kinase family protein [Saprospiraceae bacterium]|nr:CotH kinase family protein [Saprospiraceae bacterium]